MDDELKLAILSELENYITTVGAGAVMGFMNMPKHELFLCYFDLGLYIRNNILMPAGNHLCRPFVSNGILH